MPRAKKNLPTTTGTTEATSSGTGTTHRKRGPKPGFKRSKGLGYGTTNVKAQVETLGTCALGKFTETLNQCLTMATASPKDWAPHMSTILELASGRIQEITNIRNCFETLLGTPQPKAHRAAA